MKRICMLFTIYALLFIITSTTQAQERDLDALAHRIITTTATVQPGEVVAISGGQHTLPLMEALAIEAEKAGGRAVMLLHTDRVARAHWTEVDEQYLGRRSPEDEEWLDLIDVYIALPEVEDWTAVYADVPQARRAKQAAAYKDFADAINAAGVRDVHINYPTPEQAANVGIDFGTLETMHWAALEADYEQIAGTAETLAGKLRGATTVKVTSPAGTDFTFTVGDRSVFKSDGVSDPDASAYFERTEYLPSGSVYLAPVETSANGRIVIPKDLCDYKPLSDVSFMFKDGMMTGFEARQGADCFHEHLAPYDGPKDRFGWISIGLNPALRLVEDGGANYRPDGAAGMVYLGLGDNDMFPDGQNKTSGGFSFPITGATVVIDGEVVVQDGRLANSVAGS